MVWNRTNGGECSWRNCCQLPTAEAGGQPNRNKENERGSLKIEEFQAVQIWERHAAIAGLSEGAIPASEAPYTWRQSVRWNYRDLFLSQLRQTVTGFELTEDNESVSPSGKERKGPWCALRDDRFKEGAF